MRKKILEKPTKRLSLNNQNYNNDNSLLWDPFAPKQPYYKHEKEQHAKETNLSQQTDIEFDIDDDWATQKITRNSFVQKDVEIDTDLIVNERGQFQRIGKNFSKRKVSELCDSEDAKSDISLGIEPKDARKQNPNPSKKKKLYNPKPKTLDRHMEQVQNRIKATNYPQNVMKKVYPVSNFIDFSHFSNDKTQKEQTSKTKRTLKFTQNINKLTSNERKLPWNRKEKPQRKANSKNFLFNKIPATKYEKVQMTQKEIFSIQDNLLWISRVIAKRYIVKAFGKSCLAKSQALEQQAKQTQQSILQLQCMTRYRSVLQILSRVDKMLMNYEEHDQYLADPERFFKQTQQIPKEHFDQNKITIFDFHGVVIEEFVKLLFFMVMQYAQASRENKEFVMSFYQKNGYCVKTFTNLEGLVTVIDKTNEEGNQKVQNLLINQGIFQQYKGSLYTKKELKDQENSQKDVEI